VLVHLLSFMHVGVLGVLPPNAGGKTTPQVLRQTSCPHATAVRQVSVQEHWLLLTDRRPSLSFIYKKGTETTFWSKDVRAKAFIDPFQDMRELASTTPKRHVRT
jgi:hypothetical protein